MYVGWNVKTSIQVGPTVHVGSRTNAEQNKILKAYLVATLMFFSLLPVACLPHSILPLQPGKRKDGGEGKCLQAHSQIMLNTISTTSCLLDGLQRRVWRLREL